MVDDRSLRIAQLLARHFAHRPWEEMAENRIDLRLKCRTLRNYDINEPTQDDCLDAADEIVKEEFDDRTSV